MFITLGESVQEIMLERIRRAKSLGILADEAADVAVLLQLINFIKYINPEIVLHQPCQEEIHEKIVEALTKPSVIIDSGITISPPTPRMSSLPATASVAPATSSVTPSMFHYPNRPKH
ncbi:unnamed protein product [Porites evermanni]|uniref:Uncharacterized protein n=1 Tax=Porites evermanni TaxID=104178 RepID=A0ABN8Q582_9CNID|nr:unnamed protein product [Porites evermanni]